jgi:hypothetical protein
MVQLVNCKWLSEPTEFASKRVGQAHLADANLEAAHGYLCRQRKRPAILIGHLGGQAEDLMNLAARQIGA